MQNQATLLLQQIVARQDSKETDDVTSPKKEHSAWVQSMAKYRRLAPMDEKAAMLESIDERYA